MCWGYIVEAIESSLPSITTLTFKYAQNGKIYVLVFRELCPSYCADRNFMSISASDHDKTARNIPEVSLIE